jgi:hypothetical protein
MTSSWCEKEQHHFLQKHSEVKHTKPESRQKLALMAKNDSAGTTPKLKVAQSQFLLLEALSTNSRTSDINWEAAIPIASMTMHSSIASANGSMAADPSNRR